MKVSNTGEIKIVDYEKPSLNLLQCEPGSIATGTKEIMDHMEYKLPTKAEYVAQTTIARKGINNGPLEMWSEPKYICPECGGKVRKNLSVVLTSCPAQYQYKCDECEYTALHTS